MADSTLAVIGVTVILGIGFSVVYTRIPLTEAVDAVNTFIHLRNLEIAAQASAVDGGRPPGNTSSSSCKSILNFSTQSSPTLLQFLTQQAEENLSTASEYNEESVMKGLNAAIQRMSMKRSAGIPSRLCAFHKGVPDREQRTSENFHTLADTPAGDKNSIEVVGAHFDGVPYGSVSTMTDLLSRNVGCAGDGDLALQDRTFYSDRQHIWWGAEEVGLLGSAYYTTDLSENNKEELATKVSVTFMAGGVETGAGGIKTVEQRKLYGLANTPFDPCYHQSCDTVDNVSPELLDLMGKMCSHVVQSDSKSRGCAGPAAYRRNFRTSVLLSIDKVAAPPNPSTVPAAEYVHDDCAYVFPCDAQENSGSWQFSAQARSTWFLLARTP
ncbi:hypothetical protein BJ742DRAFT_779185 [Cladochytrium replicatum]|nr:hypothetical protein BJ742DRAFT_779185 [Cladochytrium replicatum]